MTKPLNASCPCGSVHIRIADKPDFINDCDCSFCLPSGAHWGYYPTGDVSISGATRAYTRKDRPEPAVEIHVCEACNATTHWQLTAIFQAGPEAVDRMGVNMNLFDQIALAGVELRFPDGKNWNGEVPYGYRKRACILGE